jgi:hypothetical protein
MQMPAGGDDHAFVVQRTNQFQKSFISPPGGDVDGCWHLHVQRRMRTLRVELGNEGMELLLLLQDVLTCRFYRCQFEHQMHPPMPAILLRVPPARGLQENRCRAMALDAFNCYAKPEPPLTIGHLIARCVSIDGFGLMLQPRLLRRAIMG